MDSISALNSELHKILPEISGLRTCKRKQEIARRNEKTHFRASNLEFGEFSLVAQHVAKDGHEIRRKYRGPRLITKKHSHLILEVQDSVTQKQVPVHLNRLELFFDSQLIVIEELFDTIAPKDPHFQTMQELLGLRFTSDTG